MSGTFASGSCERFAETVSFRCAQLGLSALSSAVLTHVASFGEVCFQTYARIAEALSLNGRKPHPESVGRIVRQLSDAGLLGHRRILPGETPERAKWRSAQGTTENRIMVGALGVKRLPKRERSALRARAAQVLAPAAVPAGFTYTQTAKPERAGRAPASPAELEARRQRARTDLRAWADANGVPWDAGPDPPE